jgi:serine protease AprX
MTRYLFFFCCSFFCLTVGYSQPVLKKYMVTLRDKAQSPYSIMMPQQYLSPAALDRRTTARIPIDSTDLPVSPAYVQEVAQRCDRIMVASRWLNALGVFADSAQVLRLRALPFVREVRYIGPFYGYRFAKDAPIQKRLQWDTIPQAEGQAAEYPDGYAAVQQAPLQLSYYRTMYGASGQGIRIAVMDGGFTNVDASPFFTHFDKRGGIVSTRDFVENDRAVFEGSFHGSGVLSVMAGDVPGFFRASASDAEYHLLITEDTNGEFPMEELNWIAGAEYADSIGVHIINASLGYTSFNDTTMSHSFADINGRTAIGSRGATIAARKGMIICNSAGNSGEEDKKFIGVPSDAPGIISVGSVKGRAEKSGFSSIGPTSDGRIKPDLVAPGDGIAAMSHDGRDLQLGSGTSYASPILAAGFAALWSAFPDRTAKEITDLVYENASNNSKPNTQIGYGIPRFDWAWMQQQGAEDGGGLLGFRRLQPIRNWSNHRQSALVIGQIPMLSAQERPIAIRLTDQLGHVFQYEMGDNAHQAKAFDARLGTEMVFVQWPLDTCASGVVKCQLIYADGENVETYLWKE